MSASTAEFASVDKTVCSPYRLRSGCAQCAAVCPADAVGVSGSVPAISDSCFGCGRCAASCPCGAIDIQGFGEAADPSPRQARVIIECIRVAPPQRDADAILVPCLGGLTVAHFLALRLAAGEGPVLLMDHGWCAECPAGKGVANPAEAVLTKTSQLMAAIGLPPALFPRLQRRPLAKALRDDSVARGGVSRRGFFRRLSTGSGGAASRTARPPMPVDIPPVARTHLRQMSLLRRLSDHFHGTPVETILPAIRISAACTNHQSCAALCPTHALRWWEGEAASGLSFDPRHCLDCGLCERACPEHALSFDRSGRTVVPAERQTLTTHPLAHCRQCGAEATNVTDGLCHRCRNGLAALRGLGRCGPSANTPREPERERERHEHT